jgi:hypothetical protein
MQGRLRALASPRTPIRTSGRHNTLLTAFWRILGHVEAHPTRAASSQAGIVGGQLIGFQAEGHGFSTNFPSFSV